MKKIFILLLMLLIYPIQAATVYWPGNYGPGDLVVFTNTQTTTFYITNSGTAGSPITFSNGTFKAGVWGYTKNLTPGGAINLNGQSHISLKNIWIEATNNGTLLANRTNTSGIYGYSLGTDIEIAGCVITNLFYKVPLADGNPTNLQPNIEPIYLNFTSANDISVHNNTIVHGGNAITFNFSGNCTNITAVSNVISDVSFGIYFNFTGSGYAQGLQVIANVCSNFSSYDGNWGTNSGDHNHQNFLIVNSTSGSATNYGFRVERNWAGGMVGKWMTSLLKFSPDYVSFHDMVFANNVLVNLDPNANISNDMINFSEEDGVLVANNNMINLANSPVAGGIKIADGTNITILNNVFYRVVTHNINHSDATAGATPIKFSDYNAMNQFNPSLGNQFCYWRNVGMTYIDWTNSTGSAGFKFDTHSLGFAGNGPYAVYPYLNTNDFFNMFAITNGGLIGAGTNLFAAGITNDFLGNPRPSSGPWTIGAFESGTNVPVLLNTNIFTVISNSSISTLRVIH